MFHCWHEELHDDTAWWWWCMVIKWGIYIRDIFATFVSHGCTALLYTRMLCSWPAFQILYCFVWGAYKFRSEKTLYMCHKVGRGVSTEQYFYTLDSISTEFRGFFDKCGYNAKCLSTPPSPRWIRMLLFHCYHHMQLLGFASGITFL